VRLVAQDPQRNQSEIRFWCKVFHTRDSLVGAFCDKDLLDKELEDDRLKIKVTKHFYGGVLVGEKVALKIMERINVGNVIGDDIVGVAMEGGFITKENIVHIDGVPHAQFIKL
jgi:uncharacterized protein